MAGLLGDSMDDPGIQGLLSLGFGLMNSRGNFGQALGQAGPQALDQYNQASQMLQRRKLLDQETQSRAQQMEMAQQQLAEFRRNAAEAETQRGRDDQFRQMIPAPTGGPATSGPTEFGNFSLPGAPADPRAAMLFQALQQKQIKPMEYMTATQKDLTPIKLGAGEVMFDPVSRQPIMSNPKEAEQPSAVKEYAYAKGQGYPGTFQQFVLEQKKAGATNVRVDAGQRFENAYSTEQGKSFSDVMAGINKTAFAAPAQIRKLERMEALLDGVDGGKLAPVGLEVASWANSVGIKMDPKLGNKEAAQALSRDIAGGFRQPGTGPMTDKDFDNFLMQVPDLSKTAEGRKQITSTMKAAAARDIQVAKMAREYERKNGRLDNGFLDEAAQYIAENPVIGAPKGWKVR
jgi:hypothetical protein